ncbi:hypothetical protein [Spirosoma sp. KUDC1026]|uniref:hypothetical protein n=1 Tax=Spirosoma sp. KUDC1026 TaxID=2745947 RepID=UPI00159BC7B1|nr:hypothetical protein [Spirosoma sp. KUDC1026]QKZ12058.1 hypothetical protein HU175_05205 [Spirosoma sp. KUDC1026]
MRFLYRFCFLFLPVLAGCDNPVQQNQPNVYYDVAGFVQNQVKALTAAKPLVSKAVQINSNKSQHQTSNINWTRELELFMQADINKPALRNSYQITRPDSATYQYTLKPTEERLTVRSLLVRLDTQTQQPRRIEAVLATSNPLYTSERRILLEGTPTTGTSWSIHHYRLTGFQQLPFFDKSTFFVEGTL